MSRNNIVYSAYLFLCFISLCKYIYFFYYVVHINLLFFVFFFELVANHTFMFNRTTTTFTFYKQNKHYYNCFYSQ